MGNDYFGEDDGLLTNTAPRVPVCVCIDVSGSMLACEGGEETGEVIVRDGMSYKVVTGEVETVLDRVNAGLKTFHECIAQSETLADSVELCVVLFADNARIKQPFTAICDMQGPVFIPDSEVGDQTRMADGIKLALNTVAQRKAEYKAAHVEYYQPQFVLFTDGITTDDLTDVQRQVSTLVKERKLTFMPVNIFEEGDDSIRVLSSFGGNEPIQAKDLTSFFRWLSKSMDTVIDSGVVTGDDDWGQW